MKCHGSTLVKDRSLQVEYVCWTVGQPRISLAPSLWVDLGVLVSRDLYSMVPKIFERCDILVCFGRWQRLHAHIGLMV